MLDLRRRQFLTLLGGGAVALPLAARAQPMAKVWRVGMLETTAATLNAANLDAFRQALRQLGYVEGQNLIVEYRSGDGHIDRFPQLAAELVHLNVDIIITRGTPAALAAKKATTTIPIVMAAIGEPVETGMVASLARPGGNVTGLSAFVTELTAKRVEIMRELIPQLSRMALIDNMANRSVPAQWDEMKRAAVAFGIQPQLYDVRKAEDMERAFSSAIAQRVNALSVGNDSVLIANRIQVVQLAARHRLPAIYATRDFVDAGGLLSYAAHYPDLYRRAAAYVDKIFKGAKPADLPVEQPTKFEIVVNLKAASALGLEVPPTLLARADEVIE
jgi:putative tryptophan/tyrosine transport system substrate-binding protein